jgi:nicotinamidase-related amidase
VTESIHTVQALIVVDMPTAFVSGDEAVPEAARLLVTVKDLMRRAQKAEALVVQLQNDGLPGTVDEPYTPGCELFLTPAEGNRQRVIRKTTDDGFHETELSDVLTALRIRRLAVCGVMSEMCVSATARSALNLGYHVVLPHDGHATYDIPAVEGLADAVPHVMASRVAEWALGDEIDIIAHAADVQFEPVLGLRAPRRNSTLGGWTVIFSSSCLVTGVRRSAPVGNRYSPEAR